MEKTEAKIMTNYIETTIANDGSSKKQMECVLFFSSIFYVGYVIFNNRVT